MRNNFDILKNAKIPKETRELLGRDSDIDNFSLRINYCAQFYPDNKYGDKATLFNYDKGGPSRLSHLSPGYKSQQINYGEIIKRQAQTATQLLTKDQLVTNQYRLKKNSSLLIGIGNVSVFETGITLHHVYGFPYIPASGIKGVVRSWIIQCCFAGKEEDAIADQSFCDMFGCPSESIILDSEGNRIKKTYTEKGVQVESNPRSYYRINDPEKKGGERMGNLIFFDAFPSEAPKIKEDIMNPHFGPYYSSENPVAPADYHSPVPVFFLTVYAGFFQFLIGSNPLQGRENTQVSGPIAEKMEPKSGDKSLLNCAEKWLQDALENHGIGAKTAVGYGFMQKVTETT